MKKIKHYLLILLLISAKLNAQDTGQSKKNELIELGLSDLMNLEISVASVTKLTPRESPGIVTLITEAEIKNSGAVDLQEVLALVPGFDFGVDVEGVVGLGIRGNWAHEGKVLLLIDGHEMNEELYSTIQMGFHYPVNNIERIEIIRGPGSAMYGGTAAYAVINILSKQSVNFTGSTANLSCSINENAPATHGADVYVGNKTKNTSYSINAGWGSGLRSTRTYTDVYGNSYEMANQSGITNKNLNAIADIKGFRLQAMYNDYVVDTRDAYDMALSQAYPTAFKLWQGSITKKINAGSRLSITPSLNYKYQSPWMYEGQSTENEYLPFRIDVTKYTGALQLKYDASSWLNFVGGTELFYEEAKQKTDDVFYSTETSTIKHDNYSVYAQALARTSFVNFTTGCRYTQNKLYGSSFVPRIGITKAWSRLHFKALLSNAFRSPSLQNMDLNTELKPETSTIAEIEAGYCFSESMNLVINSYDILTKNTIVYYYDEIGNQDDYINGSRSGTRGFEIEYRIKTKTTYLACNYSFYSTKAKNVISSYEVPVNHNVLLAFPAHKATLVGYINITGNINLHSSVIFKGPRYGIVSYDEESGETGYKKFNSVCTFNVMFNYNNAFTKNLSFGAGIKNLFNANDVIIQPYNNLHAPLPGSSRQYVFKAAYALGFKR